MLVKVAICFWTGVPNQSLNIFIALNDGEGQLKRNFDMAHKLQYHYWYTQTKSKQEDDTITREDALRTQI